MATANMHPICSSNARMGFHAKLWEDQGSTEPTVFEKTYTHCTERKVQAKSLRYGGGEVTVGQWLQCVSSTRGCRPA